MGLSFVFGMTARSAQEIPEIQSELGLFLDCLPGAVRKGFNTLSKLAFEEVRKGLLSRVQVHRAFEAEVGRELRLDGIDTSPTFVTRCGFTWREEQDVT